MVHQNKEGMVIMGGDLNLVLDPALDVSKGVSHLSFRKIRRVKGLLQDLQLMDTWRVLHAHDRDYTFFQRDIRRIPELTMFLYHRMPCRA